MGEKFTFRTKKTGGGDFKLPPEGTYDWLIRDWKGQDPTDEGDPRLYLQLEVADGPHSGEEVRDYHTLSEERGWALRVILENTGVDFEMGEEEGDQATFTFDPDDMIGRYFRAKLTHFKAKSGKTYPNFGDHQVSPLQEVADGGAPADDQGQASNEAPAGTARPRPR